MSLDDARLSELTATDSAFRYDGDGGLLRLGLDAHALGIAWESGPYFGLSVSRVDPLPHQPCTTTCSNRRGCGSF